MAPQSAVIASYLAIAMDTMWTGTYAVVDMSKKRKGTLLVPEKGEDSAESTQECYYNMALYSEVDQCNIPPEVEGEMHTHAETHMDAETQHGCWFQQACPPSVLLMPL